MKILKYTCDILSSFTIWATFLCGFGMIQVSNGITHFLAQPSDQVVKTGSTVKFVWIYEDTGKLIARGEIMTHLGGNHSLLFKVNPNDNTTKTFGEPEYLKRINITVPTPFKLSCVSAQMVLSNVTTVDTGFYSFKVVGIATTGNLSNVSLYVTESPHSLNINNAKLITKKVGESLNVNCQVSGAPTPTVTWVNENDKKESVGNGSAVLSFNNITQQHQGTYTCKGENSEGEVQRSISLKVICVINCKTSGIGQLSYSMLLFTVVLVTTFLL